jgi:putative ABC transport system permease protein
VRIPIVEGRDFEPQDDANAPGVAIVNEAFARRYFPDTEPVGERLHYGNFWGIGDRDVEIVGVVADVHFTGRDSDVPPALYFPHAQQPVKDMAFLIRTEGAPGAFVDRLRHIVADVDPALPVYQVTTLDEKLAVASGDRRFLAALLAAFAVIAVTLAGIGLYGVLSFTISRRTKEIGVRMALGAHSETVLGLVIRQGLTLVVMGVTLGIAGSLAFSRAIRALLFGISSTDPLTYLAVPTLLLAVGLVACLVPARRAVRVDPVEALSAE